MAQNTTSHQNILIAIEQIRKSDRRISSFVAFGRDEATRTPDPYVPNVVRYQLRYIPKTSEVQGSGTSAARGDFEIGCKVTQNF